MNFPFKEIRKKLLAGDFSGLFRISKDKGSSFIHPSEVAKLFISIPVEKAIEAFKSFQTEQEVSVFPYLDNRLQKKVIGTLPKARVSYILNALSSDDRTIFYSSLKGVELSNFLEFLNEPNKAVVLALFVPLVMPSGGNSGSQAATLIIRAMALKELTLKDWWWVMRRKFLSGLALGIILGTIGVIRISLWQQFHWYNYGPHWILIATTIFFSLIGIILWGTLSGSMVPMVLRKCGFDPATSSAPFIATLVDVTGLVIYFSIAALFLRGTLL